MTEYVTDGPYIRWEENIVVDWLSRPTCSVTVDPCDLPAISELPKKHEEINTYRSQLEMQGSSFWCDLSTSTPIPYVPETLHRKTFDVFHDVSHPGPTPTVKLKKASYFWPDMERNIYSWVKGSLRCQQHKTSRDTRTETIPFSLLFGRFETVHIVIIDPLLPTTTYNGVYISPAKHVLTYIYIATGWAEATPIQDTCHRHRISILEFMDLALCNPITRCHRSRKPVWKWTV